MFNMQSEIYINRKFYFKEVKELEYHKQLVGLNSISWNLRNAI